MTTSLWNCWRKSYASFMARMHASGSSPFTWKIGACTDLRDVGRVRRRPRRLGTGGEADLVVDDDVHRAAGACSRLSCERLSVSATTPCPANAASPCSSTGMTSERFLSAISFCFARAMPSTIGSTASRWDGFDASDERHRSRRTATRGRSVRAEVVLHVAGALAGVRDRCRLRTRGRSARTTCRGCSPARSGGRGGPCRSLPSTTPSPAASLKR